MKLVLNRQGGLPLFSVGFTNQSFTTFSPFNQSHPSATLALLPRALAPKPAPAMAATAAGGTASPHLHPYERPTPTPTLTRPSSDLSLHPPPHFNSAASAAVVDESRSSGEPRHTQSCSSILFTITGPPYLSKCTLQSFFSPSPPPKSPHSPWYI